MATMGTLGLDVRYALRSFRRTPAFTATVLLSLVAGVAAVTSIFSYANAVYFAPLPYHDPHRVVNIAESFWGRHARPASAHAALLLREPTQSFERVTVWSENGFSVMFGDEPRRLAVLHVDTAFSPLFALRPAAGRLMSRDEILGNAPVALLSHQLWETQYGASPDAVGQYLRLGDRDHLIVGVAPLGFRYPYQTDIFTPLDEKTLVERSRLPRSEYDLEYFVNARLRAGVPVDDARAEVAVLDARLQKPKSRSATGLVFHPELIDRRGNAFLPLPQVFVGVGVFVLLIACANVANLFLARGAERRGELAIRAALGAGRARLVKQALTEVLLIGGIAALAGTALSSALVRLGLSFVPTEGFPSWFRVTTDYRVLGFAFGALMLVLLVVGLSPALEGTRFDLTRALKAGSGDTGATKRVMRSSSQGLVLQLTLGVGLLVCSTLLARSHREIAGIDFGYPADSIAVVQVMFDQRYAGRDVPGRFLEERARELGSLPGITQVAVDGSFWGVRGADTSATPRFDARLIPDGDSTRAVRVPRGGPNYKVVSDGFFDVLGMRMLRGRSFDNADVAGSQLVAVISATAARKLWPDGNAVGRSVQVGVQGPKALVVGIVGDVNSLRGGRDGLRVAPVPTVYHSIRQAYVAQARLTLRGTGDVRAVRGMAVSRISAADPQLLIWHRATAMADQLGEQLLVTRVLGGLVGSFAFVALILSVIGTYGVVAFGVAQRTREIGIRMALGGTHADVMRHIMGGTARFIAVGLVLGIAIGMGLGRLMRIFLFGVTETDPVTYALVCGIFAVVATLACWLPARRATRVDPLVALRAD